MFFREHLSSYWDSMSDMMKNLRVVVDQYAENLPAEISLALKEILEKDLTKIDFSNDMDNKELDDIIYGYMKKSAPTLKQLSKRISDVLHQKMQADYVSLKNTPKE